MVHSTPNKGWSTVNYCQYLAFDHPYLSCNDHGDWWLFQEIFFINIFRSSLTQMFFKTGVIRNFTIFTGKHYGLQLYFNLIPKETSTQVFSCEYCKKFYGQLFLQNTSCGCFCQFDKILAVLFYLQRLFILVHLKKYCKICFNYGTQFVTDFLFKKLTTGNSIAANIFRLFSMYQNRSREVKNI